MNTNLRPIKTLSPPHSHSLLSLLAVAPLDWLLSSWDQAVSTPGPLWLATLCGGAWLWRTVSEQIPGGSAHYRYVLSLLVCGAALRSACLLLGFGSVTAAAAWLDGYALHVMAGGRARPRSRRLAWLNAAWTPTEMVLAQAIGAVLQPIP
jgi:hypothetical protein